MKAHTELKEKQIILSIGMIVKNEEKVLERCLKSLQPLMKAIPCELIIADTGSTDSSVEIAKKYTDNVFHFEWINDFAAARNSTLKKAKGVWYFFVDADEYLDEDIHEIVEFFKIPELYNHYRCAEIAMRNYTDKNRLNYDSCLLPRFHRIKNVNDFVTFEGAIHETIYIRYPLGYFQTILHHTGYAFNSDSQFGNKLERNRQLMLEEYKHTKPDNRSRILTLLLDGAFFHPAERAQYIKEGLELAQKDTANMFSRALFLHAISYYSETDKLRALNLCNDYFNVYPQCDKYVATIDVIQTKAQLLAQIGKYKEAYGSYVDYFGLYQKFKEEKLEITDLTTCTLTGVRESVFFKNNMDAVSCLINSNDYEKAFDFINSFDLDSIKDTEYSLFILTIKNLCIKSKTYSKLVECYQNALYNNNTNKVGIVLETFERIFYYYVIKKERLLFAEYIVKSDMKGRYSELMQLYIEQNNSEFKDHLIEFIHSVDNWKFGYSEAIYLAVKNQLDISDVVMKIDSSMFEEKLNFIANTHDDFAEYVLEYGVPEKFLSNIKLFRWIVIMYEVAAYRCFELNDEKKYELYMRFTNLLGEYISNIYNPELIENEEDVEVLPPLHRFGYYMLKANTYLNDGNQIEYIREMKKALINCESMKEMVEFLLEQFKKQVGMS